MSRSCREPRAPRPPRPPRAERETRPKPPALKTDDDRVRTFDVLLAAWRDEDFAAVEDCRKALQRSGILIALTRRFDPAIQRPV